MIMMTILMMMMTTTTMMLGLSPFNGGLGDILNASSPVTSHQADNVHSARIFRAPESRTVRYTAGVDLGDVDNVLSCHTPCNQHPNT